ncbi:peptidoglycan hydrolase-like protein with peptidoglycan-binding domain [Actinoplanes campanulatus]|uniref:Peptidoglycan hydrolase-like protein with peptidoglycan-binding domain n=1 Tax=Actinoplanes campanulatus TaxID=113559 RepID=A0A7W5FFP9_9ACTN|nr:peptidoglycan-binding protein [Actinoplanes campanulatus]MBB3096595.1 peptidoglycan hydrolase-like protein with peptidoglycan-binding domain [Actinoplanes campanulatus]GGN30081.1 peptidoglycan-binding protein [Actinoplanes campanulatus]GID37134.1 peptidoglycan-binding protein [Actinoplanes campanulatus]
MSGRILKVVAGVVVIASAGTAAVLVARPEAGAGSGTGDRLPPAGATVSRQTLRESVEADGELGYGPARTAAARRNGTVTWLPDSGATVTRGKPLYRIDDDPAVLMYGTTPAYRSLSPGAEGRDVAQLERNLAALGYDGFTADDEYTGSTAGAVEQWQKDNGLPETGVVALGQVVFASGAVRVDSLIAEVDQAVGPGRDLLTWTRTGKVITVRLDVSDAGVAKVGAAAEVTLPGGRTTAGRVIETATVIEPAEKAGDDPTTEAEVQVTLTDAGVAEGLGSAAVDVTFTAAERRDVLTVPVAALLAAPGGGFLVEVVDGAAVRRVPVRTGLFADGRVEVTGDGLAEGMTVGVPG